MKWNTHTGVLNAWMSGAAAIPFATRPEPIPLYAMPVGSKSSNDFADVSYAFPPSGGDIRAAFMINKIHQGALQAPDDSIAEQRAVAIYDRIAKHRVSDLESYLLLGDLLKEVKKVVNKFEEENNPEIKAAHELHKKLIERKKRWSEKFSEAEKLAKDKISRFYEISTSAGQDIPKMDGVSLSELWTGEVVKESLIPREYMTPDLDKLKAVTKRLKEATNISGWKIKKTLTVTVRD